MSPTVTIESIYLCTWTYLIGVVRPTNVKTGFYAAINFGSCGAISASFLARDHGYWVAWLIPTGIFCLVPLALLIGKKNYVITPPRGSILLEVCDHGSNIIEWY